MNTFKQAKILCIKNDLFKMFQVIIWRIFSKQWPLAPNSPKWQITRANVSRRVTFFSKWPLANVSECIESRESGWRMSGECIKSGESGWQMSGECIESDQNRLAIVGASKIGRVMHK